MKLYNTLTRKLEDFQPMNAPQVSIYACGPTVYSIQHIGNMRAAFFADLVQRSLQYVGYQPILTRNYTDVGHLVSDEDDGEDKMEKGANKDGVSVWDVAEKYIKQYDTDVQKLGNNMPNHTPRATQYITQQLDMVKVLLDKGFAYITPEAVYFDVSRAPNYTRLSRQKLDENRTGAGHGQSENTEKRNPYDFVLWFFRYGDYKNHTMHWDTKDSDGIARFYTDENQDGDGFPGWHIECSAMIADIYGKKLDIHIGGIEHIPTHHTNEIAQSDNALDVENFTNYWLHLEHLLVDGTKMSKSAGNAPAVDDLEKKGFSALDLRYFFLNAHYRSQQNFTWEALADAQLSLTKLREKVLSLNKQSDSADISELGLVYKKEFVNHIENDFNTSGALGVFWTMLKDPMLGDQDKYLLAQDFDTVLGIQINIIQKDKKQELSSEQKLEIEDLITQRLAARLQKDFQTSDAIRDQLIKMGVEIEDKKDANGNAITDWKLR